MLILSTARSQTITDTAQLRALINTWIVPNSAITATKLNKLLTSTVGFLKPGSLDSLRKSNDSIFIIRNGISVFVFKVSGGSDPLKLNIADTAAMQALDRAQINRNTDSLPLKKRHKDSVNIATSDYTTLWRNTFNVKYDDTVQNYNGTTSSGNADVRFAATIPGGGPAGGNFAQYNTLYNNIVDLQDAFAFGYLNTGSLSFDRDGAVISVERRNGLPNLVDTLFVRHGNNGTYNYALTFTNWKKGAKAFLKDLVLNTTVDVTANVISGSAYNFTATVGASAVRWHLYIHPAPAMVSTNYYVQNNLNVKGDLELNDVTGTAGQVVTSQGAGLPPVWATVAASGSDALKRDISDTTNAGGTVSNFDLKTTSDSLQANIALKLSPSDTANFVNKTDAQTVSGAKTFVQNLIANGYEIGRANGVLNNLKFGTDNLLSNSTGSNNIAIGSQALQNNTTGVQNTSVGHSSMVANVFGNFNAAFGYSALNANTTGIKNTALGAYSLLSNTTGTENLALGQGSMVFNTTGYKNVAVGTALIYNTTGYLNVAIGDQAMLNNVSGYENVAIGQRSLRENLSFYNTAVGSFSLALNILLE